MSKVIKFDLGCKEKWKDCFEEAATVIKGGGVIAYPTETFYGLGCNGLDVPSLKKIFKLKERSFKNPLLLLISCVDELYPLINEIPVRGEQLMNAFWPGPLTMVFKASERVPAILTSGTGKVGVRIPDLEFTRAMILHVGLPLVGTSANTSGKPGALDVEGIEKDFADGVDLYLDAGKLEPGSPSTVVDLTGEKAVIVREGKIAEQKINKIF